MPSDPHWLGAFVPHAWMFDREPNIPRFELPYDLIGGVHPFSILKIMETNYSWPVIEKLSPLHPPSIAPHLDLPSTSEIEPNFEGNFWQFYQHLITVTKLWWSMMDDPPLMDTATCDRWDPWDYGTAQRDWRYSEPSSWYMQETHSKVKMDMNELDFVD